MQRKTIYRFLPVKNFPQLFNLLQIHTYLSTMFFTTNRVILSLFIVFLAGSVVFAMERMLFVDASLILTRIINYGSLQIQEHRYGSFITQAFPWLASQLNLPLIWLMVLYSMSFNLFYLAVVVLILYKFRQPGLALLMAFYYILFVSDAWFWTNNEVHQGIAWMFLFFAVFTWMDKKNFPIFILIPVFTVLAFLSIFSHPLVILPFVYLWLFFLLEKKWPAKNGQLFIYSLILLAISISKFWLSTSPGESFYDIEKLESISGISPEIILSAATSPLAKEIMQRCLVNYWLVPLLLIAGIYSAVKRKKYKVILLTILFSTGYLIAICITFKDFIPFYMESELMSLSIITSGLFAYYTFPSLSSFKATFILTGIFAVRLIYIGAAAPKWIERKEWIINTLQVMREQKITKGVIYENDPINRLLIMNWGVPMESLLASAVNGDHPQLSFVVSGKDNIKERMPEHNNELIGTHTILEDKEVNHRYFNFDTTSAYQLIYP